MDWMLRICNVAWKQQFQKTGEKASLCCFTKERGIRLASVSGMIHGRVLGERMMKVTLKNVCDEQVSSAKKGDVWIRSLH